MKINNITTGLIIFCLLQLSACSSAPALPAINIIDNTCVIVAPCQLSPIKLTNNNDLLQALIITENDWADCAAQVDATINCQQTRHEKSHAKTRNP